MRILVLQESDWMERGPHQSHHLLERMSLLGHTIRVLDFEIGWRERRASRLFAERRVFHNVYKVVDGGGVTVIRPATVHAPVAEYASAAFSHALEIRRQMGEFQPDVVIGFGILNAFLGIQACARHEVPFAYYIIDELHRLVPQAVFQGLARVIEQYNMRNASLVLSINEGLRAYSIAMGARRERTQVVRAGIDLNRFHPETDGSAMRTQLGFAKQDLVLFFMGWLYPFSGLEEVAEGILQRTGNGRGVKLLIVGKGDSWNMLDRLRQESRGRIVLVGWQPYTEIPKYLAAADICLLPARRHSVMTNIVPIKVYEYLAAGKPVLATRLPGIMKEFGDDHGVLYVNDPRDVVPKAIELAASGLLPELSRKARAFVEGNDWTRVTNEFESILVKLHRETRRTHSPG